MNTYCVNQSFEDFQAIHDLAWADAQELGGLTMNAVGRSFFFLRAAQITDRQLFAVRARVDGGLARHRDTRCQLLPLMMSAAIIGNSSLGTRTMTTTTSGVIGNSQAPAILLPAPPPHRRPLSTFGRVKETRQVQGRMLQVRL